MLMQPRCISLGMLVLGAGSGGRGLGLVLLGTAGARNGKPGVGAELVRGAGCMRLPGLCCLRGDCSNDICEAFSTLLWLLGFA